MAAAAAAIKSSDLVCLFASGGKMADFLNKHLDKRFFFLLIRYVELSGTLILALESKVFFSPCFIAHNAR